MPTLKQQLAELEARADRIRRAIRQAPCAEVGHAWKHIGGANAGCGEDCMCSVPVHECTKCGDCDYGDNAEGNATIHTCHKLGMD